MKKQARRDWIRSLKRFDEAEERLYRLWFEHLEEECQKMQRSIFPGLWPAWTAKRRAAQFERSRKDYRAWCQRETGKEGLA